jgi:hypothetical protein
MDRGLDISHLLFRIEPEKDIDIDPGSGPARTDAMEFGVLIE